MRWLGYVYTLGRHQELYRILARKPERLGSRGIDGRIFIMDLK
jgi:hypothetical protein